jgi:gliding motility-associated transport system ATP-binding protein
MIHVENLTKYYNDLCAVDQISFDISKGEIMGLLGPNGAGKTTTLQILTGFLRPTSGSIRIKDYSIDEDSLQIKKLLGYLPESAPLYHDMLVYDYLDYVANIRGIDSSNKISQIRHLAGLCGISEVMHKTINELSKGFKQRVGLAHAMMDDPEILVLDEPTSGLDPNQIIEIRDIIKQIGREKTVILSTHILSEAEATCDRIVIINNGIIVANDSTQALKQSVSGNNLISISLQNAEFESVNQQLTSINGISDIVQVSDDNGILNLKLTCMSSADIRGNIYKKVKQTDWILIEMHQETQTLENIFRELTRGN